MKARDRIQSYESFQQLKSTLDLGEDFRPTGASDKPLQRKFHKLGSLREAINAAENGYPEALENMPDKAREMIKNNPLRGKSWTMDVADGQLDVGSYLSGRPDCFFREVEDDRVRNKKTVRIAVGGSFHYGIDEANIQYRGAAIAAMIDALESRDYRVELDVLFYNKAQKKPKAGGNTFAVRVNLKKFDQPLDLDRMLFAITVADFNRRIIFRSMELISGAKTYFGAVLGKGYAIPLPASRWIKTTDDGSFYSPEFDREYDVLFDNSQKDIEDYTSPAIALDRIVHKLEDAGIEIDTEN